MQCKNADRLTAVDRWVRAAFFGFFCGFEFSPLGDSLKDGKIG